MPEPLQPAEGASESLSDLQQLNQLQQQLNVTRANGLRDYLKLVKEARQEALKAFKDNEADVDVTREKLKITEKAIAETERMLRAKAGLIGKTFTAIGDKIQNTLGLDLKTAGMVGVMFYVARLIDAQRVTESFVRSTLANFGTLEGRFKSMGSTFLSDYMTPNKEQIKNMAFVTQQQRQDFVTAAFQMGLQIRNISGDALQSVQERLLALSNAFGMTTNDIAGKLTTFNDIFRFSTGAAALEIENLTKQALALGVAPARFLDMTQQLTSQFKLQRIQIHDVQQVFEAYYRTANLGVNVTEELTSRTVSALGQLEAGRIAAYLAITKGMTGKALSAQVVKFYDYSSIDQVGDRLYLVIDALNKLRSQFASGLDTNFAQVRLVMEAFGIQDMETGTRLWQAVDSMRRGATETGDAVAEAREILLNTSSAEQMLMTLLVNGITTVLKYLGTMTGILGGGEVSGALKSLSSGWDAMWGKVKDTGKITGELVSSAAIETNTSLEKIQAVASKSYDKLAESVAVQKQQLAMASIQQTVSALAAPTSAAASAAAAAAAQSFMPGVLSGLAQKLTVGLTPEASQLLQVAKDAQNSSVVNNVAQ